MAPATPRNGTFSPTLSSAASISGNGPSRIITVSRLAIEGKVKQNAEGASIKLYLKISVPVDSVNPGQIVPIFAEENVKIRDYSVHPLDSDSVPYNFSSTTHTLLHNAARALNLPARSTRSYFSVFDTTPQNTPGRNGSVNGSAVPALEERYTGYFLISGYNVCYVLPKEFPTKYKAKIGTDSEGDVRSARGTPRTPSYRSGSSGRRYSVGERNTMQFVAGLSLWVPFSSRPPKAPYLLSIPIPRCLSNVVKVRLPSPSSISTSFASLDSEGESNGWDLATEPHVTRTTLPKHGSRTGAYVEYADDESSEASFIGGTGMLENCMVQGTFPTADAIRIRWAVPLRAQDFPDGRRRVGVDEVEGKMTCTVLESRADGLKMRLDYQGTCSGVWFPGVATMLGMDVGLDTQGARVTWPPDSDCQWTIDGDSALTGFTVGSSQTGLSPQTTLELPAPDTSGLLGETIPNGPMRNHVDNSTSLLRAPLPNRRLPTETSFEDSLSATSVPSMASSVIRSSDLGSASESFARPPSTPITVHINMNELAPTKNKLTLNISGTVLVAPGVGLQSVNDSGHATLPLPMFRVFSATKDNVDATIRNQCDNASVELINTGSVSSSNHSQSPRSRQSLSVLGSRAKKTVIQSGGQARCITPENSEILVKPLAIATRASTRAQELSPPQILGRSVTRATVSQPGSPEPASAVLRSQASRLMAFRDGPLVLPWVNADVVPIVSISPDSRSSSSKSAQVWSYAVTLSLPTPVDGPSEWLEFGLALPPAADTSQPPPAVQISCASVNGVPVRCEIFDKAHNGPVDLAASTSSVGAGSTETIGAVDNSSGARKWLSWIRVHIALAGALEVVYIVKGRARRASSDKKGKSKASSNGSGDRVNVFLPVFSLPISRFEINLRRSSDIIKPKEDSGSSEFTLYRKVFIYDVPAFVQSDTDLTIPHPRLTNKVEQSRTTRNAKRTLRALTIALPYIISTAMLTHTITMRQEVRELRSLMPSNLNGGDFLSEQATAGSGTDWRRETVTVTSTITPTSSSRPTSSERRWFGDTYTVSYSAPTQKVKAPPRSPTPKLKHMNTKEDDDDVVIEDEDILESPGQASRGRSKNQDGRSEDGSSEEGSSLILHLPLSWPAHFQYQQTKAHLVSTWGRLWHVIEVILHWPLPVDGA